MFYQKDGGHDPGVRTTLHFHIIKGQDADMGLLDADGRL
jgi:hypothetical protein